MSVETVELAPGYRISRILRGGWQLAGGHGPVDRARAIDDMFAFVDAGVNVFDCADIYTGVEETIGAFRRRLAAERGAAAAAAHKVHTKFVPDWDVLPVIDDAYVERIIDRSRARLGMERLDLVQFHWWNYAAPRLADAGRILARLQREGRIALIGGTNFDAPPARLLLDAGVELATMQIQYSPLDARPAGPMSELCAASGMKLLCYGTLAGGFLSERWLGQPRPAELVNRSLVKYLLVIDEFGGWDLFQALLAALARVGARHGAGIAATALRWTLDQPHVAGAIVGARYADHLTDTLKVFGMELDARDRAEIAAVLDQRKGPAGDCYTLERDRDGPHGRIMKYNLNTG
jgi:aryl-alcohol dehydrogenase-like predicted oxidoreductase